MKETIEQTIKRLHFCQNCIDTTYQGGMDAYELLEKQIKELNKAAE